MLGETPDAAARSGLRLPRRLPRTVVESLWVSAGTYALYGAMFVVSILVNRVWGTAELGRFGMAWAVAQLTVQSGVAGLSALHRRDVAYGKTPVVNLVAHTLGLRSTTLAGLLVTAALVLIAGPLDRALGWAVGWTLLAKAVEALGLALAETLQAEGHNRIYGVLSGANAVGLTLAAVVVWRLGTASRLLYPALAVAALAYAATAFAAYVRTHGVPSVRLDAAQARATWAESWPLVVNAITVVVAARLAVLVVGALEGETAAGVYTFASGVVGGAAVVASAVGTVLFPRLCIQYVEARHTLLATMRRLSARLAVVGALAFVALAAVREPVVSVYGQLPEGADTVLLVLAVGLVPAFAFIVPGYLFTAIGAQREGMRLAAGQATLLAALVIPASLYAGALGAAFAAVSTQVVGVYVATAWLTRRYLGPWASSERTAAG